MSSIPPSKAWMDAPQLSYEYFESGASFIQFTKDKLVKMIGIVVRAINVVTTIHEKEKCMLLLSI